MVPKVFKKVFDKQGLQKYVHANGLTVILRAKKGAESVTLCIGTRAGVVHHPLLHLDHHMIFRGIPGKDGIETKREAVRMADTFDACSDLYSTLAFIRILPKSEHIRRGFELLSAMVQNPAMNEKDLEKEKQVVIREIKGWQEEPRRVLRQMLFQTLYTRHPAREVILENTQIQASATREQILETHQKFYQAAQRLIVVAVGNFHPAQILKLTKRYLGNLQKSIENPFGVPEEGPARRMIQPLVRRWHGEQSHIMVGLRAPVSYHPDAAPMRILSAILGEDLDSRLYTELRENRGLVHVRGPLNPASEYDCSPWHGILRIYACCDPKNCKRVVRIIRRELQRFAREPVATTELKRNQDKLVVQRSLLLAGTKKHAHALFAAEIGGALEKFDGFPRQIRNLTAQNIQRVGKTYCVPAKIACAILNPPRKSGRT